VKEVHHQYDNLSEFLNHFKGANPNGRKKITEPLMFGSAYDTFGADAIMDPALKIAIDATSNMYDEKGL